MRVFPGNRLQILHLQVFDQDAAQGVGVGQLIAGRVDLEEVGIALIELIAEGVFADKDKGIQRWRVGILFGAQIPGEVVGRHLSVEHLHPAFIALFIGQFIGIGVVVDVELLEVVRWTEAAVADLAAQSNRQSRTRFVVGIAHGRFVDDFKLRQLAIDGPRAAWRRCQIAVAQHIFKIEAEVFGGEGFAVRPFMPFAQMNGEGGLVVGDVEGLGDVGNDGLQVSINRQQLLQTHLQHIPAAASRIG